MASHQYRVKHLLINYALFYSLHSTVVMLYLNYCFEIFGNTYKSRIQPLHIIRKRAIRICRKAVYRSHTRRLFHQLNALTICDTVNFKSMVFMNNVHNKLLPANIMLYLKNVNACHNHSIRMKSCNLKVLKKNIGRNGSF